MKNKRKSGNALLLCYYFPPMGMGGTQRSAKFAKYLHCFGWEPHVVTVKDVAYYAHDNSLLDELKHVKINRTESFDPLRMLVKLSRRKRSEKKQQKTSNKRPKNPLNILNELIGGFFFIPDNKILWLPFAVFKSVQLIRKNKIKVVFTTSPPQSTHLAGMFLKCFTSVKWIADFRDDWTGGESQPCPTIFHLWLNRLLEKAVLNTADHVIGMCEHLTNNLRRKGGYSRQKFSTIMNGYDSDDFKDLLSITDNEKLTITHCGSISRVSNPEPFLTAVSRLNPEILSDISIQFIGTDIFGQLAELTEKLNLQNVIEPIKYLPHKEALKKVMASHILLITIFKRTNEEIITGKIFEYLASGKHILLISQQGEVARMIHRLNRGTVIKNDDINSIENEISHCYSLFKNGRFKFYNPLTVDEFDRRNLTAKLTKIFDEIV